MRDHVGKWFWPRLTLRPGPALRKLAIEIRIDNKRRKPGDYRPLRQQLRHATRRRIFTKHTSTTAIGENHERLQCVRFDLGPSTPRATCISSEGPVHDIAKIFGRRAV